MARRRPPRPQRASGRDPLLVGLSHERPNTIPPITTARTHPPLVRSESSGHDSADESMTRHHEGLGDARRGARARRHRRRITTTMIARGTHATRDANADDANANAMTTRVLFLRTDVVRSREKTPWWRRRRSARDWARNPEDATRGVRRRWAARTGVGGGTCARGVRWGVYVSHRTARAWARRDVG